MNIDIKLSERTVKPWYTDGKVSACGTAFLSNGSRVAGDDLAKFLSLSLESGAVDTVVPRLNGFFAFIVDGKEKVTLVVDRIRSIPLFYGNKLNNAFVSDDAEWVRHNVGDRVFDDRAKEELLFSGYVTGNRTLFNGVRQVQAGELVEVPKGIRFVETARSDWFTFKPSKQDDWDEEQKRKELEEQAKSVSSRLIDFAAGRKIVLPLSAGYDSQFIALGLAKLSYSNVLAFSYGRPNNRESIASREIARALGMKWTFVEYTNSRWRAWYRQQERIEYYLYASGYGSVAHLQDWPAVGELKRSRRVEDSAVFVPGHSGLVMGGMTPREGDFSTFDIVGIADFLVKNNFALRKMSRAQEHRFRTTVLHHFRDREIYSYEDAANATVEWLWKERHSKFIINSIRAYEFFGMDWWLPLWDSEFVNFWRHSPLNQRKGKIFLSNFVDSQLLMLGSGAFKKSSSNTNIKPRFKRHLPSWVVVIVRPYRLRKHPLAIWGRYPLHELLQSSFNKTSINAVNAAYLVRDISDRVRSVKD